MFPCSTFRTDNFIKETTMGLEALQMKDRVRQIASALHKHLDPHYPKAVEQIKLVASGFEKSLDALYHLTPLFTAGFAIRPFLNQYPELIKQGHPGVFEVIGFTANPLVEVENITIVCSSIHMGEELEVSLKLRSLTDDTQHIVIDYNIHHRKANGKLLPKVFKWTTQT